MNARDYAIERGHPSVYDELTDADRERLSLDDAEPGIRPDELMYARVIQGFCPFCAQRLAKRWPTAVDVCCTGCGMRVPLEPGVL